MDSGMAWTTIATGLEVDEHGIISINNVVRSKGFLSATKKLSLVLPPGKIRTYIYYGLNKGLNLKDRTPRSSDVPFKRLWDLWDGETLAVGVPMSYPAWETEGVMLSGIPAPLEGEEPGAYPGEYEEYRRRFNGYHYQGESPLSDESQPNKQGHLETVKEMTMEAFEVTEEIASERDFEMVFAVYPMIDDSLHALDPETERDRIEEVYEEMDRRTEELVEEIDPDHVVVVSDHGMMPSSESINPNLYPGTLMDHDSTDGIWRSDLPLDVETQPGFAAAVLEACGQKWRRERLEFDSGDSSGDEQEIKTQLEKMGYLD
jgi:predicted AlkP superfamily pyrophosphatase or phosphodiesterase